MDEQDPRQHQNAEPGDSAASDAGGDDATAAHGTPEPAPDQTGATDATEPARPTSHAPLTQRRGLLAGLIWAIGATLFSLVFVVSFVGALHNPGPRSVTIGYVGSPTRAAALSE